jgi:hypothetical protein
MALPLLDLRTTSPGCREGDGMSDIGLGYTLGTGRLYCDMAEFHRFAEKLLDRPILTHEFADERVWAELRAAFETHTAAALFDAGRETGRGS